jgi:hypothetical protein
MLCVWKNVQERSFCHVVGLFFFSLTIGWTNRQRRVCVLLEQLDKKGKTAFKKM